MKEIAEILADLKRAPSPESTPKRFRYISQKCTVCGIRTSALGPNETRLPKGDLHHGNGMLGVYTAWTGSAYLNCRQCGKALYAKRVLGKFNAAKKCTAKCLSATGHTCECACGGKNHGSGYESPPDRA